MLKVFMTMLQTFIRANGRHGLGYERTLHIPYKLMAGISGEV